MFAILILLARVRVRVSITLTHIYNQWSLRPFAWFALFRKNCWQTWYHLFKPIICIILTTIGLVELAEPLLDAANFRLRLFREPSF